jgi:hypothetical protein
MANHQRPIASIEVQGLTYDALMLATHFFPSKSDTLQHVATELRERTLELLWREDTQYFSLGADYTSEGVIRIIKTATANPAALLDSSFFDDINEDQRRIYISGIVRTIMGRDFLTDAGIRSRSLSAHNLVSYWDYHGSYTTWPKETYDIAKGLRRQDFHTLARELENRLLNIVLKNKSYPEFVYVDEWGRVLASSPGPDKHGAFVFIESTNQPERTQAWTVSAIVAIINNRVNAKMKLSKKPVIHEQWRNELEQKILAHIPRVNRLFNPMSLTARYPTYTYRLNKKGNNQPSNLN